MDAAADESIIGGSTTAKVPITVVPMADYVVHHTWVIRSLSSFVTPLDLSDDFSNIEDAMSNFLRAQRATLCPEADSNDTNPQEQKGTFVGLFWSHLEDDTTGFCANKRTTNKRKSPGEQPVDSNARGGNHRQSTRHLIIDIRVQDELSAQIILCFPRLLFRERGEDCLGKNKVKSFEFCLARGSKHSYEAIFGWLEASCGCKVAKSPLAPSVAELAQAMTIWTTEHWQQARFKQFQTSENNDHGEKEEDTTPSAMNKPLTLTFAVPSSLATAGLDTISLNVPPAALLRLCSDMLVTRRRKHSGRTEAVSAEPDFAHLAEPLPVLEALQFYIHETFRINIKPFSLVRASCSVTTFSCDGKFKPHCPLFLRSVLQEIRDIILHRSEKNPENGDGAATLQR